MTHEGIRKLKLDKYPIIHLDDRVKELEAFKEFEKDDRGPCDAIITIVLDLEEMAHVLNKTAEEGNLKDQGMLFMLYPKKGNKTYEKYIHRDSIFDAIKVDDDGYFAKTTLKFNSMTAFDETFTALGVKNMPKRPKKRNEPSQSVDDYVDRIPELEKLLDKETLKRFHALTPGYQRGWARHVFSTKTAATQKKRLEQMKDLLAEGYKSIDLWRKDKK